MLKCRFSKENLKEFWLWIIYSVILCATNRYFVRFFLNMLTGRFSRLQHEKVDINLPQNHILVCLFVVWNPPHPPTPAPNPSKCGWPGFQGQMPEVCNSRLRVPYDQIFSSQSWWSRCSLWPKSRIPSPSVLDVPPDESRISNPRVPDLIKNRCLVACVLVLLDNDLEPSPTHVAW